MKSTLNGERSELIAIRLVIAALLSGAAGASAEEFAALNRLALAESEEYVAQRDALLRSHPQTWEIEQASAHSWQAGLAAYVLNGWIH